MDLSENSYKKTKIKTKNLRKFLVIHSCVSCLSAILVMTCIHAVMCYGGRLKYHLSFVESSFDDCAYLCYSFKRVRCISVYSESWLLVI